MFQSKELVSLGKLRLHVNGHLHLSPKHKQNFLMESWEKFSAKELARINSSRASDLILMLWGVNIYALFDWNEGFDNVWLDEIRVNAHHTKTENGSFMVDLEEGKLYMYQAVRVNDSLSLMQGVKCRINIRRRAHFPSKSTEKRNIWTMVGNPTSPHIRQTKLYSHAHPTL